ncbi:hypothetical protein GCM10023164_25870 [Christiangramia aestuarii]
MFSKLSFLVVSSSSITPPGLPPENTGDLGSCGASDVHETNTIKYNIDIGNLNKFFILNSILSTYNKRS